MRPPTLSLLAALSGALLSPSLASAADSDRHPSLGGAATLEVVDAREADQRGDGNLGWYESDDGDLVARGPGGEFSLRGEVTRALLDAGDEIGVALYPGRSGTEPHHVTVEVDEYWCDDTVYWVLCHARLNASIAGPSGRTETFELEDETPKGYTMLRQRLRELLLVELARVQNAGALEPVPPSEGSDASIRFGWIEQANGNRYAGRIADARDAICVAGRGNSEHRVPLVEIAAVRVVDVPLPGVREGDRWAVLPFPDGSWLGGRVAPRPGRTVVLLQSADGARLIGPTLSESMISGPWSAAEPTCGGQVLSGGVLPSGTAPRGAPVSAPGRPAGPDPDESPVVYVDRRGDRIDDLGPEHREVFAMRQGRLGTRRWGKYRMSWLAFSQAVDSPVVDDRLATYIERNRKRKQTWSAMVGVGIGSAIGSGVLSGVMTTAAIDTGDTGLAVSAPIVAGGIGVGSILAVVGAIQRVKWGKRADKPGRYYDLTEFMTLDELDEVLPEGAGDRGP